MPISVFTTDDIEALKTKLKAGLTEYDADLNDDVKPIHGFLPPIKQEKIKELCELLKLLENQLAESGRFTCLRIISMAVFQRSLALMA
jgi:hypothetical protein